MQGGSFTQIAQTGQNETSYSDTGLTPDTEYTYRVRAFNDQGTSDYSNEASAQTHEELTSPASPSDLSAEAVSKSQINLSWTDDADNEQGFTIERKTQGGSFTQIAQTGSDETSYSDSGLLPDTEYTYRVRAFNDQGTSDYSNEASAQTQEDLTPPAAPSDLSAGAASTSQINLSWTDNADNENGFTVERKTQGGSFTQIAQTGSEETSYSDSGLSPDTEYIYRVRAFNDQGTSVYSNEASAQTFEILTPPDAPSDLSAEAVSKSQINLSWTDDADNEQGFAIERKTEGGSFAEIGQTGSDETSYSDTGLTPDTEYTYRVRAFNDQGTSDYSNEASAQTLKELTPPDAPSDLSAAAVSTSQIELTWTDNADNENGFTLERKESSGNYQKIAALDKDMTTFADSSLSPETQYSYRVFAFNDQGNSDYSNTVTLQTPLASFSPSEGAFGESIVITGSGFGGKGKIYLQYENKKGKKKTKRLKVLKGDWTDTKITCTVKKKLAPGNYDILIKPANSENGEPLVPVKTFTVMNPEIIELDKNTGSHGDKITAIGRFFGTKKGKVFLQYTNDKGKTKKKKCKVKKEDWTTDAVTFTIPKRIPCGTVCDLLIRNKTGSVSTEDVLTID